MKNARKIFIVTSDKNTAEKLMSHGCQQVTTFDGTYKFLNCPLDFEQIGIDTKKIAYTNVLCI